MTFEQFLEIWNSSELSVQLIRFISDELGYADSPKILEETLEWGMTYADFFEDDPENKNLLIFLKAICITVIFLTEDTEIQSGKGHLWNRAMALIPMKQRRIVRIPLDPVTVEKILKPLESLRIHKSLFEPIRSGLAPTANQKATTALRRAMARLLVKEEL